MVIPLSRYTNVTNRWAEPVRANFESKAANSSYFMGLSYLGPHSSYKGVLNTEQKNKQRLKKELLSCPLSRGAS